MPQSDTTDPSTSPATLSQCNSCLDDLPPSQIFPLACTHSFCQTCLIRFFKSHTTLRPDFPPKCCGQQVYAHDYRQILPDKVVKDYVMMTGIHKMANRTLCATPKCNSRPIEPYLYHNDWALCEFCVQLTCVRCGNLQAAHIQAKDADENIRAGTGTATDTATATDTNIDPPVIAYSTSDTDLPSIPMPTVLISHLDLLAISGPGSNSASNSASTINTDSTNDSSPPLTIYAAPSHLRHSFIDPQSNTLSPTTRICPRPILDPETEALATGAGWKRCPSCHVLVEREEGCSEMTCVCGRRFCYDCGGTLEGEGIVGACRCEEGEGWGPGPGVEVVVDEVEIRRDIERRWEGVLEEAREMGRRGVDERERREIQERMRVWREGGREM